MPITLAEAKLQLRVDSSDDDVLIQRFIDAAGAHVERYTGQLLTRRQVTFAFDQFDPDGLEVPAWPAPALGTVTYLDPGGVTQTLTGARLIARRYRPRLMPATGTSWPATGAGSEAILVQVTAGYDAGLVAADLVAAILMLVAHWYRNREAVNVGNIVSEIPLGVDALLAPHRMEFL
jgi:uncharacterized phiE125 gp8 family phage protein